MSPYYNSDQEKELNILRSAVESTNEAFITIDQDHKVVLYNKGAEKIFGYKADEVLGRDLNIILSPECSKNHHEAIRRFLETRQLRKKGHITELVATRKNGEKFPINISFSTFELDGKIYFTAVVTDISEIKHLQEKTKIMERLALLGKVVAEISHEIKNPLMMIGGFANQLLKSISDEKSKKKLEIIINEVKRLENLLASIKEYYAPPLPTKDRIDVARLLKDIFPLLKAECKRRNIEAKLNIMHEGVFVLGNEEKLKQVIINIAKNGIDAMKEGGILSISSKKENDRVKISISDTGNGIPKEIRDKIFDPFFTTKTNGSGLGLGISKKIIEDHNGKLDFVTEEGKGTTFTIILPIIKEN